MTSRSLEGRSWRGRLAEAVACAWLRVHGCSIVARRRRLGGVEVDVVARLPGLALVVEVKSRGRDAVSIPTADLVSPAQRLRLQRAADALSARVPVPVRVDLVEIRWSSWPPVRWHRGPWIA